MGQQQLLLLVLATIIVGIAIVVGIRAFNEHKTASNADALTQDIITIAQKAQAWKTKPAFMGGQPDTQKSDMEDWDMASGTLVSLQQLGFPTNTDNEYVNLTGEYVVSQSADAAAPCQGLTIRGESKTINDQTLNIVEGCVTGVTDQSVTITTVQIGEETFTPDPEG